MRKRLAIVLVLATVLLSAGLAEAGRSGGSFGGRGGFRSAPRAPVFGSGGSGRSPSGGGGPSFVFLPSFGWGYGGYGTGCGGPGSLMTLLIIGVGAWAVMRTVRRAQRASLATGGWSSADDDVATMGQAYVYKVQVGLGRTARQIQDRLARFAAEGDTSTETGLAQLLQQTMVELLREKDSIRYAGIEAAGPMSLMNGETKLNGIALGERARFSVERVRGAEGRVTRAGEPVAEGQEALEIVMVTIVLATRMPVDVPRSVDDPASAEAALSVLGGVAPEALLGLEVIWTPADPDDSMTEMDVATTYPELRHV